MTRRTGFTLVELLVVIAIIAILAGIAVPKVSQHLKKAKVTRALTDVKAIELAFSTMLADTGRSNICDLFVDDDGIKSGTGVVKGLRSTWNTLHRQVAQGMLMSQAMASIQNMYTDACYRLLRTGKDFVDTAELTLRPDARKKLSATYLELGLDPWQNKYQILPGGPPRWPGLDPDTGPWPTYLRCYRGPDYRYDFDAKVLADQAIPGNPMADGGMGFPAPINLSVCVYSMGEDGVPNQSGGFADGSTAFSADGRLFGGGDDVNNWDNTNGWDEAYSG